MAEGRLDRKGHVIYFEPTDMDNGRDQDGNLVSLMPHFEDFCIAMTLTAEIYPREKDSIQTIDNSSQSSLSTKSISWICYATGSEIQNQQIVNGGFSVGEENFLTTYYTEISADNYVENEIIEGLGVTSVNISYESWYTPTITIKFIDVHGSSLWGREEAIHDNDDKLTADNVLGVFFAIPYPLFRLQVKGFLGHDVTYQLTVSSFKGTYNSRSGNFEATATFIGYSYSLLTDIPIQYLAYVSEMSYVGKQYWNDHVNTPSWQLVNADNSRTPPIPLYKLIQSIKSAVESLRTEDSKDCDGTVNGERHAVGSGGDVTAENNDVKAAKARNVTDTLNSHNDVAEIETALSEFETSIKNDVGGYVYGSEGTSKQLLLLVNVNSNNEFTLRETCHTAYKTLCEKIDSYNGSHPNNKISNGIQSLDLNFHERMLSDDSSKWRFTGYNILKEHYQTSFSMERQSLKLQVSLVDGVQDYKQIKFGAQKRKLFQDTANTLKSWCDGVNNLKAYAPFPTDDNGNIYAYLLPLGDMWANISNLKTLYFNASTNIQNEEETKSVSQSNSSEPVKNTSKYKKKSKTNKKKIVDMVGFEPTIGNFVKLLMCHLETFAEVMMHCGEEIYRQSREGKRDFGYLGVNENDTDITSHKFIWPWPALYRPDYEENNVTKAPYDGKYDALGWPNDFESAGKNNAWEEKELVLSIKEAISLYEASSNGVINGIVNAYDSIPMSGSDLTYAYSPFARVASSCDTIEKLSPYLGLRIANVIGVADSNCSASDAEAIGYMDAVNMISATSDYGKLRKAIESNGTDKVFSTQVINYLTCSSSVKPTNSTDGGNHYNSFETIRANSGNYYSGKRHPMFCKKNGNDNYTYSYVYAEPKSVDDVEPISLVPTQLLKFDGTNNPYKDLFTGKPADGNGVLSYSFTPTINNTTKSSSSTGVSQEFVYTANTNDFLEESGYPDYTNEQLFYVVNSISRSRNIREQIKAFKNGDVKYRNYAIKGEDEDAKLKAFFNRRYMLMDDREYYGKYNGHVPYAAPMSEIDYNYAEKYLCESSKEKDDITYNNNWISTSKSELYTKYENSARENKTNSGDNVVMAELPIRVNDSDFSLFGTKLYFQQNNIDDTTSKLRDKCKAYLILTSMVSGIGRYEDGLFCDSTKASVIQNVQPCYVYFLGALLWRRKCLDESNEPLCLSGYENTPSKDASFIRKSDGRFYVGTGTEKKVSWLTIDDYLTSYGEIDISVRNKLINLFENFANSPDFKTILRYCELRVTNSEDSWDDIRGKWTKSTFDKSSPSQWTNIFSNIFGNYASIVVPSDQSGLRLLFSEGNNAMDALKNTFGLNGGFVIGRGTANRVGAGKNEVSVTSGQMRGYLSGFEQRIKDLGKKSTENEEETANTLSEVEDRNLCMSMYYSLKQLWDAWLISAKRDQFTIENFFNKYFIFIDSFYVNTYNTIKLNCQTILDAYNTKDISLLGFIEQVTSEQRCMFFSIPNFIDINNISGNLSNVRSYRSNYKENAQVKDEVLRKMFTPYAFNEMGSPQTSNVFIFVYTQPFSENASESNGKKYDSYSISKDAELPGGLTCEAIQDRAIDDDELVVARSAYTLPCFGVTVNRGNNYIFKGINVSMDSPKVTGVAAQTTEDILMKFGRGGGKRVYFYGQDIFKIYSQYSYQCEIEMMGCVQIQPLMYFELLNMPMWRGTYMIYKVTHSMQAGTMTTRFIGIKMSKYQAPPVTEYYTETKYLAQKGDVSGSKSDSNSGETSECDASEGNGLWAVGGDAMIKNIFGDYTGYKLAKNGEFLNVRTGSKGSHLHAGVDLSCPKNTSLHAPWDGHIYRYKTKEDNNYGGNRISFVDDSGKYLVTYMHCESFQVTSGDVKAGEVIALSGNTGGNASTGSSIPYHLHLELHIADEDGKFNFLVDDNSVKNSTRKDPIKNYGYIGSVNS